MWCNMHKLRAGPHDTLRRPSAIIATFYIQITVAHTRLTVAPETKRAGDIFIATARITAAMTQRRVDRPLVACSYKLTNQSS